MRFFLAIFMMLVIDISYSWSTQQTPEIKAKQQSESIHSEKGNANDAKGEINKSVSPPAIMNNHDNPKPQENRNEGDDEGTEFWPSFYGYRLKITDTLLAIFTFGLFIATWFLYCATRDLVRGADDTAKRQLRAYLSVTPDFINSDCNIGSTIENHGLTPAYKITTESGYADILPHPLPLEFNFKEIIDRTSHTHILAPRQTLRATVIPRRIFSKDEIAAAIEGTKFRLYVFGAITYTDAFDKSHRTEYCRSIQGSPNLRKVIGFSGGKEGETDDVAFEITPQHNNAD
ncbi:MAG: hypothetical protein AABZ84_06465 [Pseudomonadota bacterium]